MADKTTTLKTKTNDNVYPNIIGDNRDNAIVDSAHINHTLTAAHKINFRLDTNVSKLIFNSLQKPTGLTKTKLVGVGTNGQENIEIGDNLTLANGKLSASGGGGEGSKIAVIATDSNWTTSGSEPSAYWSRTSGRALKPNTAYEVGDNVTVEFQKSFNTQYLQENQIIVPCSSKNSLAYRNYTLKYGDVVLVLTNSNINLQCSSSDNKIYHVGADAFLTYSVVKAGTTGADVSLPSGGWNCAYSYTIYTLGISAQ